MRCLLDKVTVRYLLQGLRKLGEQQTPTFDESLTLNFFAMNAQSDLQFYMASPTANVLQGLQQTPRYAELIRFILQRIHIVQPARYHKRWARRLRQFGFTREDAAMLALATFGLDTTRILCNMDYVITFDQPMINHWTTQQASIRSKLSAMQDDVSPPYRLATLPRVIRPDAIASHKSGA